MKIFYKNNGAISVFLCLILLPVLLLGGMTADAARIYMSKVVISDAGEMAMNAGLAQYQAALHDEYGLFVMEKAPESMTGDMAGFFNASLNGTGIPGAEDYKKILDLLTENFSAMNVAGSEIYRTEVEKQQILEYMKYRAPVCLTELVLEKLKEMKDTKKMTEAMEAEMDFSEAMEDCQDAFEKAKKSLDQLERTMSNFPNQNTIEAELDSTQRDITETAARCLLMREIIQHYRYSKKPSDTDLKIIAEKYVAAAKKVNLSEPCSAQTFNQYMSSMYYMKTVDKLGGIKKLLKDYDESAGEESNVSERNKLVKLTNQYNEQKKRIEGYSNTLFSTAKNAVDKHRNTLNGYRSAAQSAEGQAGQAYRDLNTVKTKLKKASEKFASWKSKTDELASAGKAGDMAKEVEDYQRFFSDGNGQADLQKLENLMSDVEADKTYFNEIQEIIKKEKFFEQSIATVSTVAQTNRYRSEAAGAVSGSEADYNSEEQVRKRYIIHYSHTSVQTSCVMKRITNDPFYQKLQEYCNKPETADSQNKQKETNDRLDKNKEAAQQIKLPEKYPVYNWGEAGVTLPSAMLGGGASNAGDALTDLDTDSNVNDRGARRNIISKYKESIKAANNFLDGVDSIVTKGAENLYIAEYVMQMFSYYTVDMKDGQSVPEKEIIGLSGYELSKHKPYRAEGEYILWGKSDSRTNVLNTVMMIFGIRMLFNSFFAFTNKEIDTAAMGAAELIAGAAPYLIPVVKVVIKLGFAGLETADDILKIQTGYGVSIFKDKSTWATFQTGAHRGDNTKGVTFDYSEYLRVFLNVSLLARKEAGAVGILGRIADCIQVNKPDVDLMKGYTMLAVQADVKSRTTFMRKISDWGKGGGWSFPDDYYTIRYQSVLGY